MFRTIFIVGLVCLIGSNESNAQSCISQGNTNWNNTSTWSCDGVNRLPTCGDTIYVRSIHTVSVTNQNNYEGCSDAMILDVSGNLAFTNGNKLELPCGSVLSIQSSGAVYKSSPGGGTSTLISICNANVWTAGDGPLNGPTSFGGEVLPVELIEFSIDFDDGQYIVTWSTASEINNDYFTIENSVDGTIWETIQNVAGAGFSNELQRYESVLNAEDIPGEYFRLRQTDFNGSQEVVAYAMSIADMESMDMTTPVWPNPTSGTINIDLSTFQDETVISLVSLNGETVFASKTNASELIYTVNLVEMKLCRGVYGLMIQDAYKRDVVRVSYFP